MSINFYLLSVGLVLALSCKHSLKPSLGISNNDTVITNKVIKYTGESVIDDDKREEFTQRFGIMMGLPELSKSLSELSFRVWLWGENVKYVINIEKVASDYSGDLTAFNTKNTDSGQMIIIHFKVTNLKPISGWAKIVNKLENLEDILSREPYPVRQDDLTLMTYVQFEMEKNGAYNYAEFLEPSYYRFVHKDALTVHDFLKTLNKEFRIQGYMPAEKPYKDPEEKSY